jgi:superfamily I DNA/RNA helicase
LSQVLLGDRQEELGHILGVVAAWLDTDRAEHICIAARTHRVVNEVQERLEDAGIDCTVLETDASVHGEGVRLATFHRLKGLEFPKVLLAGVEQGLMPLRIRGFASMDAESQERWDQRERCLLYVAATRARDELVVTGSGKGSGFLG